jgi:hypothetical protein
VGRHTAPDGEAVHPVVAEALARRPADAVGAHRGQRAQRSEGSLGWPGEPPAPGTGGLGWPGDLTPTVPDASLADAVEDGDTEDGDTADEQPEEPVPPADGGRRRGWRRLLGLDRAA